MTPSAAHRTRTGLLFCLVAGLGVAGTRLALGQTESGPLPPLYGHVAQFRQAAAGAGAEALINLCAQPLRFEGLELAKVRASDDARLRLAAIGVLDEMGVAAEPVRQAFLDAIRAYAGAHGMAPAELLVTWASAAAPRESVRGSAVLIRALGAPEAVARGLPRSIEWRLPGVEVVVRGFHEKTDPAGIRVNSWWTDQACSVALLYSLLAPDEATRYLLGLEHAPKPTSGAAVTYLLGATTAPAATAELLNRALASANQPLPVTSRASPIRALARQGTLEAMEALSQVAVAVRAPAAANTVSLIAAMGGLQVAAAARGLYWGHDYEVPDSPEAARSRARELLDTVAQRSNQPDPKRLAERYGQALQ